MSRYGGEEFAVVLPTDGRNAGELAFTALQRAWRAHGWTFSAGLAEHRAGSSGEVTLEAADRALYRARRTGRDRLVHAANLEWAAAVEALARITHPDTEALLLPAQFLPLAERTGRVGELDRQVAAAAIAQVATGRHDPLMADLVVGVNASVDHPGDAGLRSELVRCCQQVGLPTGALTVEITETLQSVTGRGHEFVVQELRDAGLHVALDDVGTGFSTLSYLLRFPVTRIKIDMSFTAGLASERGRHLVDGILKTAEGLELHVVAEGVETVEQRDWLTSHGCRYLQGYLFSRLLPAEAAPAAVCSVSAASLLTSP